MARGLTMGLLSPMMSLLASQNFDPMALDAAPLALAPVRGGSEHVGFRLKRRSRYSPHQGKQECARRVRQMQAQRAKAEG